MFRVYNKRTLVVEETINVKFIEEDHRDIPTNERIDLLKEEFQDISIEESVNLPKMEENIENQNLPKK